MATGIQTINGLARSAIASHSERFAGDKGEDQLMDFDDAYANMAHIPMPHPLLRNGLKGRLPFGQTGNRSGLTTPMVVTRVSALICSCRKDRQRVLLFSFTGDIGAPLPKG